MPSEKYTARRGSMEDGMRMITACFARAPQRCPNRLSKHFLLTFQEVTPLRKTRNQLQGCEALCALRTRLDFDAPLRAMLRHPGVKGVVVIFLIGKDCAETRKVTRRYLS